MLDQEFCLHLEYAISRKLESMDDNQLYDFWCDGVLTHLDERYYSKEYVRHNRKVCMRAYSGVSGQESYELTLYFGPQALAMYATGASLVSCIPPDEADWFTIHVEEKLLTVQLP